MRDLLVILLIVVLSVWWATKNPHTAGKLIMKIETLVSTVVGTVTD